MYNVDLKAYEAQSVGVLVSLGFHTQKSEWKFDYALLLKSLQKLKNQNNKKQYYSLVRKTAEADLWFFMFYVLSMPIFHPYLVSLAYELQEHKSDNYLYLAAARGSWKSTFLTIGMSLWETALDHNTTCCILSYEKQMATKQLLGVKTQCEQSPLLHKCWPETFWSENEFRSKKVEIWSLRAGMFCRRDLKTSDPTWAAFGFIEGLPTGMHFSRLIIDDPVTLDNSATVDSIDKVRSGFKMLNGIRDRERETITRVVTTRYDVNDLSKDIIDDKRYYHIIRPAEVDEEGRAGFDKLPVFRSREQLDDERESFGDAYYAAQMLQDPTMGGESSLNPDWLTFYQGVPDIMNVYIFVDPAKSKNRRADFTVICVIGVSTEGQFFLLDMVRDKIDVFERFDMLKSLHKAYRAEVIYYEIQALNSDLEVFEREMASRKYYMPIEKFSSNAAGAKDRRIKALAGMMRRGEFLLPEQLMYDDRDLIEEFVEEEYKKYPNNRFHDDMLDCMGFVTVCKVDVPATDKGAGKKSYEGLSWEFEVQNKGTTWMSGFTEF